MSWNDNLYLYAQTRGGEYFGGSGDWLDDWLDSWAGWDGMLLLEHKGAPMVVCCRVIPGGRGVDGHRAQVLLRCELERDYRLKIGPKNLVRQGLNLVLDTLDRGAERLNRDVDIYRDYDFPEVTRGRSIKTDDPDFTQLVLRDLELRRLLLEQPGFGVAVSKSAPDGAPSPMHLVTAWADLKATDNDWGLGEVDWCLSAQEKLQELEKKNIIMNQKLDALIGLAKAAHGAVMTWRMPEKKIDK